MKSTIGLFVGSILFATSGTVIAHASHDYRDSAYMPRDDAGFSGEMWEQRENLQEEVNTLEATAAGSPTEAIEAEAADQAKSLPEHPKEHFHYKVDRPLLNDK